MSDQDLVKPLQALQYMCHQNAVLHGFYDHGPFNFGEKIALIHSELSECLESHRQDEKTGKHRVDEHCPQHSNVVVELADAVIRIFDLAAAMNVDLANAIIDKHNYNKNRPYLHDKSY